MLYKNSYTFKDTLHRTYTFSRWRRFDENGHPEKTAVFPCRTFARQRLDGIAANGFDDPFHYRLKKLWLTVFQKPWAQPRTMHKLLDDLAVQIAKGQLHVYLDDTPLWHNHLQDAGSVASSPKLRDTQTTNDKQRVQGVPKHSEQAEPSPAAIPSVATTAQAPISPIEARKARYREREDLVARTSGNPTLQEANERLAFNNDSILRAEAAEYVYRVDEYRRGHISVLPESPIGLEVLDPTEIQGLEGAIFTDPETGFGAALFESQINGEIMLTYRGTNNGVTGGKDWLTNFKQGFGKETKQYNQAMDLAEMSEQSFDKSISIVGHSLGGGLASAGIAVTGLRGYTFNAAGLHPNTVARKGGLSNNVVAKLIQTQAVDGEVLTALQKHGSKALTGALASAGASLGGPAGAVLGLIGGSLAPDFPQAVGQMQTLPSVEGGHAFARHGMDQVIEGIEAQKKQDIATLINYA